jgi:streptogramin lyase
MALGADGNLWFSEELGNRIGRITPAGVITEFTVGLSPGANPGGIVAGPDGSLWFVERVGNRIGRITTAGVITEFSAGISPGAIPVSIATGSDGNLWFVENTGNRVGRITTAGVVTEFSAGISAGAGLSNIAAGPDGNLWFTEGNGNRVAKITTAGVVTEFSAGITAASNPNGLAAGPDGNLWFTELNGNRIGRITTAGGVTEFSAGITPGSSPRNIAPGPDGNLWFTETAGNRIGRITTAGVVTEFSAGITPESQPWNVVTGSDGNLWFTEYAAGQIGQITPAGVVTAEFSAGITKGAGPIGITVGPDGNLWFAEPGIDAIGRITPLGVVTEFRTGISQGSSPIDIVTGADGNLWFTEYDGNRIGRITPSGVVTEFSAGISPGSVPAGIAAGPDGALWFAEQTGSRIGRITTAGAVTEFAAGITAGSSPTVIVAGPDGNLWFTEEAGRIGRITIGGVVNEFSAGITAGATPEFIAAGPDGSLWFTEYDGNRIGRITTSGVVTEFSAGISANSHPNGIAAGPDGNLWFTEDGGNRVGRITTAGVVTQYSAGITANAGPVGIVAGPDGNLWFAEAGINRIARITTNSNFVVTNKNDSGAGSLRDAIAQANVATPPSMITFDPSVTGTILLTSGQINVGQAVSIVGPGSGVLTIDANANSRVFSIFQTDPACPALDGPDYLVSISGLRLTNARRFTSNGAGAIFTEHSLALDSVQIDNSIAGSGGALYFQTQYPGQSLVITNSQFLNNKAQPIGPSATNDSGGALAVFEKCASYTFPVSVGISGSLFTGNQALPTTNLGQGGAIAIDSHADVAITDTRIIGNQVIAPNPPVAGVTYQGGGMSAVAKTLTITRSEISLNSAVDVTATDVTRGGGVRFINYAPDRQTPAELMMAKIINSTLSGNSSSATGGGVIAFGNVSLELDNSTLSNNTTTDPTRTGGILITTGPTTPPSAGNATTPTLTLVSSIAANNAGASGDLSINTTTIPSFTVNANHSLIRTICPSCSITVSGSNNLPAGTDPLLAPLANNGGPTQTQALMAGSPAIDAGSNPLALATDQRGAGFPRTIGAATDMGAYEATVGSPVAPVLQSAVSRKLHGAAGTFDLPLTLIPTGVNHNPTTEPRTGPAQTIVLTFDKPITAATVTITEGVATAVPPTFSGKDVIVNLTGVTNQQYVTVSLTNVASSDGGSGGTGSVRVGFLLGDVSGNRVVSIADLAQVNAQLAQAVTAANYLKDVNASGTLSVADKAIANANLTRALSAP